MHICYVKNPLISDGVIPCSVIFSPLLFYVFILDQHSHKDT